MKPEPQISWSTKAALWLIAISLATIAICLVLKVNRFGADDSAQIADANSGENANPADRDRNSDRRSDFTFSERTSVSASYARSGQGNSDGGAADSQEPTPVEKPANVILAVNSKPVPPVPAVIYSPQYQGVISGTVRLIGEPPPEMPIDVGDVPCADPAQPQRTTRNFVTDTNGGLADTLVFISDGLNTPVFPVQTETLELDFTNCLIEPYVSAAMVRQKLVARDATGLSHALRFMAEDSRIIGFEKTLSPNSSLTIPDNQSILFGRVSCGTHPWERAYVSLLRQPYFAVTDEHGQFAITNVPPGRFTLEARHRSSGGQFERNVRTVNLSRSGSVTVDFQISSKVQ